METAKVMRQPTVVLIVAMICSSLLIHETNAQNACETDCVRGIYANNCGQASCITGVSSSEEFNSLCGPACISAISGGGMLDCLTFIGGSTDVQNSFVLTVQNFCAQGDPFAPLPVVPAASPAAPVLAEETTDQVAENTSEQVTEDATDPVTVETASEVSDADQSPEPVDAQASVPPAASEAQQEQTQVPEEDAQESVPDTAPEPDSDPVENIDEAEQIDQPEQALESVIAFEPAPEPDTPPAEGPEAYSSEIALEYYDLFDSDEDVVGLFDSDFEGQSDESTDSAFTDSYDVNTI